MKTIIIKVLTGTMLILVCDSFLYGQIPGAWEKWIKANSSELSLGDTANFKDLSILKKVLKDKSIVFLGENSHGVSEYTLLKSRMIRYLHDSLGFNVLVFETNAGDAYASNLSIANLEVNKNIYNSISTAWHVEEIIPLFNYIKRTHATKNPLNIAGIDITMSNGGYTFSKFLNKLIQPLNPTYAKEVALNDSIFSRLGVRQWTIGNVIQQEEQDYRTKFENSQLSKYKDLISYLDQNKQKFSKESMVNLLPAKQYIQSRIEYIHFRNVDSIYMANKLKLTTSTSMNLPNLYSKFRDYMMSKNLEFLVSELYPGEKLIVWAQDAHITKKQFRMPANPSYSNRAYTIGLFCYSGKGSFGQGFDGTDPDSLIYTFRTPGNANSMENIMSCTGYPATFLDLPSLNKSDGNSWVFESSTFNQWDGTSIENINDMRTIFDGLIVVGTISPPKFLNFNYEYLKKQ